MSSVVISGDTSGAITLSAPAVSGTNTATLPAATGTVMVSGNMPAFSYTNNAIQTFSSGTFTKISFQTSNFDTTGSMFSSSRFTPTIAGYYNIIASLNQDYGGINSGSVIGTNIYKNGSNYQSVSIRLSTSTQSPYGGQQAQSLIYLNGSTDYVEIYAFSNNNLPQISLSGTGGTNVFSGVLVRTA